MSDLASIMNKLGKGAPSKYGAPDSEAEGEDTEAAPDSESGDSSATEYARTCCEAIADKDFDAAGEALKGLVRAMK